jgi:glucan 1,3-beta-glucosidase
MAHIYSYLKAHNMIRSITGVGEGPWISIHDGFKGTDPWKDFLPGSDRFIMDQHPYFAFGGKIPDPFINGTGAGAGAGWPLKACQAWWSGIVSSQKTFGVTIAGEFSNGWNDCGLFLHGVDDGSSQTYDGDCNEWMEWEKWDAMHKDGLNNFLRASMDTLGNWFFWTWKVIGYHTRSYIPFLDSEHPPLCIDWP